RNGGVVGGGVCGAAGVSHDEGAVAEVGGLPGRAFDREVGGYPGEQDRVDAEAAEQMVELAGGEPADPLVGDDEVGLVRGELVENLRLVAAVDQAPGLLDDLQDRGVDDQICQAGLPGDAGVDDGDAGEAGGLEQSGVHVDDATFD